VDYYLPTDASLPWGVGRVDRNNGSRSLQRRELVPVTWKEA